MLDLSPPDFFGDILVHDCNNWKPRYQKIGNSSLIQRFLGKSQESLVQKRSGPTSATMRAALGCARTNPCWALGPSRTSSVARIFAQAPARHRSTGVSPCRHLWRWSLHGLMQLSADAAVRRWFQRFHKQTPGVHWGRQTARCSFLTYWEDTEECRIYKAGGQGRVGQELNNLFSCILLKTTSWYIRLHLIEPWWTMHIIMVWNGGFELEARSVPRQVVESYVLTLHCLTCRNCLTMSDEQKDSQLPSEAEIWLAESSNRHDHIARIHQQSTFIPR